jgi:hypothetical protein
VRPVPRSLADRAADTLALLRTEADCWVASADEMGTPISSRSPIFGITVAFKPVPPVAGFSRTNVRPD